MLKNLVLKDPYRPFAADSLSAIDFCGLNLVYGRNGSGKSSFSSLMSNLTNGGSPVAIQWQDSLEARNKHLNTGDAISEYHLRVFDNQYVEKNLAEFLRGSGASPGVILLGEPDIESHDKETKLLALEKLIKSKIDRLNNIRARSLSSRHISDLAKNAVCAELAQLSPARYGTSVYRNTDAFRSKLENLTNKPLSEDEFNKKYLTATPNALKRLSTPSLMRLDLNSLYSRVLEIMERTPKGQFIQWLDDDKAVADWVRQGLALHGERQECVFCAGVLEERRVETLSLHFSEDREKLETEISTFRDEIGNYLIGLEDFLHQMPGESDLVESIQAAYKVSRTSIEEAVDFAVPWLREAIASLEMKLGNPTETFSFQLDCHQYCLNTGVVVQLIESHNQKVNDWETYQEEILEELECSLLAVHSTAYIGALNLEEGLLQRQRSLEKRRQQVESSLRELQAHRANITWMAEKITEDLKGVFNSSGLRIGPSENGDGYLVYRDDRPAVNLSEGEKNTIALSYFINSLFGDETRRNKDKVIVVIDDPVSSLDRENTYGVYSWIVHRLSGFLQVFILTHDSDLYAKLIDAYRGKYFKRQICAESGVAEEGQLKQIGFFELHKYLTVESEVWKSRVRAYPDKLLHLRSEYHYLFKEIAEACMGEDELIYSSLGNSARRVLEAFANFKIPNSENLRDKLVKLSQGADPKGKERVAEIADAALAFCHEESHSVSDGLIAGKASVNTRGELRKVILLLHAIDKVHCEGMLKSCGFTDAENFVKRMSA